MLVIDNMSIWSLSYVYDSSIGSVYLLVRCLSEAIQLLEEKYISRIKLIIEFLTTIIHRVLDLRLNAKCYGCDGNGLWVEFQNTLRNLEQQLVCDNWTTNATECKCFSLVFGEHQLRFSLFCLLFFVLIVYLCIMSVRGKNTTTRHGKMS